MGSLRAMGNIPGKMALLIVDTLRMGLDMVKVFGLRRIIKISMRVSISMIENAGMESTNGLQEITTKESFLRI